MLNETEVRALTLPAHVVKTPSFQPLSHGEALTEIDKALGKAGLEIARDDSGTHRKRFTVTADGARMYATLPLTTRIDESSRLMIGIVNSWNKSKALRIAFGAEVFVCTNGSIFAEKVIGRKHTTKIIDDLPGLMSAALEQTKTYVEHQTNFFKRLREVTLTDSEANDFIVQSALDHECITRGEIADVVDEWRKPRYEDFAPRNAWSLHNAFTEVGKRIQAKDGDKHSERMVSLSGFFANRFASDLTLAITHN